MKRRWVILLAAVLFTTCVKEEVSKREYPRVRTWPVIDISSGGAHFKGEIIFTPVPILDHGFVWSDQLNPRIEDADKISLGLKSGKGAFDAVASRSLAAGKTYYVRAFAKSENYLVYGDNVSFLSLGGMAPVINAFSPTSAELDDTVSIRGSNFNFKKEENIVAFNDAKAYVTSATDTLLKVIVPSELGQLTAQVSVSVSGNKATASGDFTLLAPKLISADKSAVKLCDTLTMVVEHMPKSIYKFSILFADAMSTKIILAGNKLKAVVPFVQVGTSAIPVKFVYGNQTSTLPTQLTFLKPAITELTPATPVFLDTLTVNMANVPRCGFTVKLGNTSISPVKITDSYFRIVIPTELPDDNISLKTYYNDALLTETSIPRTLRIDGIEPQTGNFGDIVKIKGAGFDPDAARNTVCFNCNGGNYYAVNQGQVIHSTPHEMMVKIPQEFMGPEDGNSNVWVYIGNISGSKDHAFQLVRPVITSITPSTVANGDIITVKGQHFNPDINYNSLTINQNSKKLQIVSASATQLTFEATAGALSTNNAYLSSDYSSILGLNVSGRIVNSAASVHFLYEGPWTKKTKFPGEKRVYGVALSFQDKIFYGLGRKFSDAFTSLADFWEYDPASDQWMQLADFPGVPRSNMASWVFNNTGYVGLGSDIFDNFFEDMWRFNPVSKSWVQLPDFPETISRNGGATVFNNLAYIAAGSSKGFWTFDQSENWTHLDDLPQFAIGLVASQNSLYAMMGPNLGTSEGFKFYRYNASQQNWTYAFVAATVFERYFSAYGKVYSCSLSGGGTMTVLFEDLNGFGEIYSPLSPYPYVSSPAGLPLQNKIFMFSSEMEFYQFDPALFPPPGG